jgi:uncharacterized damage-inducible protein DinB
MTSNDDPEIIYATLASLRQTNAVKPTRHVSFEERVEWDPTSDTLPKFEGKDTPLEGPMLPMVTRAYTRDMAFYNRWQNDKLFALCHAIGEDERRRDRGMFFKSIHNTLNHILTIDDAIFTLLQTGSPKHIDFNTFPYEKFCSLRNARSVFDDKLANLANEVDDAWFAHILEFESSHLGRKRRMPRAFMLMQMFNHQTHHRSQITSELFRMGIDYGNTDMPYNPFVEY